MIWKFTDGIAMCGRFSAGWNFHHTRTVRTLALPLALSFAADRVVLTVGPFTLLWIHD